MTKLSSAIALVSLDAIGFIVGNRSLLSSLKQARTFGGRQLIEKYESDSSASPPSSGRRAPRFVLRPSHASNTTGGSCHRRQRLFCQERFRVYAGRCRFAFDQCHQWGRV